MARSARWIPIVALVLAGCEPRVYQNGERVCPGESVPFGEACANPIVYGAIFYVLPILVALWWWWRTYAFMAHVEARLDQIAKAGARAESATRANDDG